MRGDQLARQWLLIQRLARSRYGLGLDDLAAELGCVRRTVYRDLDALMLAGFPVVSEKRDGRVLYRFLETFRLGDVPFTPDEILALAFGEDLLRALEGTVFHDSIRSAIAKIRAGLGPELSEYLARLNDSFRVLPGPHKSYAHLRETIRLLNQSVLERRTLRIRYRTGSTGALSNRELDPYRVWYRSGGLYVVGFDHKSQEIRTFAVDRIRAASATERRFEPDPGFDFDATIGASFGVIAEPPTRRAHPLREALGALCRGAHLARQPEARAPARRTPRPVHGGGRRRRPAHLDPLVRIRRRGARADDAARRGDGRAARRADTLCGAGARTARATGVLARAPQARRGRLSRATPQRGAGGTPDRGTRPTTSPSEPPGRAPAPRRMRARCSDASACAGDSPARPAIPPGSHPWRAERSALDRSPSPRDTATVDASAPGACGSLAGGIMRSRRVLRLAAAGVGLAVALALAGVLAWSQRRTLVHGWVVRELALQGITPVQVEVERFDTQRLELRGLRAGAGEELTIDSIDADYSLADLWNGRVSALRMSGIRLRGEIRPEGARFGGLEALAGSAPDAATTPVASEPLASQPGLRLPALPTNDLVIDQALAEIETAEGPLRIELSVDAHDRDGRVEARADLVARHALANAVATLDLAGSGDRIGGAAAIGLDLAPGAGLRLPLSQGSFALGAQIEIEGQEVRATLAPAPFRLTLGDGPQALRLEGTLPPATLESQLEDGELAAIRVQASGGDLRAPGLELSAKDFVLDADFETLTRIDGRISVGEIVDTRKPARMPRFSLECELEPKQSELAFDLRATEAGRRVVLYAEGSLDPATRDGQARLRIEPLHFAEKALQPEQVVPQLKGWLSAVAGALEATGHARFSATGTQLQVELAARDLSFDTPLAQFEKLNGTLRFDGPRPLSTPPAQLLSIARIGFGLDLTDGLLGGRLQPDGVVVIDKAEWQTLGGRVHTAGAFDPGASTQAFVLEAEDLDLGKLLALVELDGLSGEGRIDGTLPLVRSSDAIEIQQGVFRARPGGRVSYRPSSSAEKLGEENLGFAIVLEAFEDLTVEKLELTLDGATNGPMQLSLRLIGVNPEYQDGRPVHFNLNVESRLADLLRRSAAAARIPQVIEERLQRFGQPAK